MDTIHRPHIAPIHAANAHRPSICSDPPSPPSMHPQPFTPSEPGTDELFHQSSYPPSPAHPPEFAFLEPIHNPSYPSSPVFPSGLALPAFSGPGPSESILDREPPSFNDQNFLYPLAQPPHHRWPSYPASSHHMNEPRTILHQNHATFYTPPLLPPTPSHLFYHPAPQETLWQSTEIDTFKSIPTQNYTPNIHNSTNNLLQSRNPMLYTPSPPPTPLLSTTTAGTTMCHQNKPKQINKSPPIPRSKKKKPSKLSSGIPRICKGCSATDTPEWRSGPDGERNFCNACGLRWKKAMKSNKVAINKAWVGENSGGKEMGLVPGNVDMGQLRSMKVKVENVS